MGGSLTTICRHSSGDLSPCHRPPAARYRWVAANESPASGRVVGPGPMGDTFRGPVRGPGDPSGGRTEAGRRRSSDPRTVRRPDTAVKPKTTRCSDCSVPPTTTCCGTRMSRSSTDGLHAVHPPSRFVQDPGPIVHNSRAPYPRHVGQLCTRTAGAPWIIGTKHSERTFSSGASRPARTPGCALGQSVRSARHSVRGVGRCPYIRTPER